MSVFQAAMPTGTYPSLMAGGVVAAQGAKSDDLDDFKGSAYYGKSYYWPGGQTPSNAPSGAEGGLLLVQRCGDGSTAQIFITHRGSSGTTPPTVYQRSWSFVDSWSDWEEIVTSNGNYPNLGAGYLANTFYISAGTTNLGWIKLGSINNSNVSNTDNPSVILLINGIYASQAAEGAAGSGIIEFEARRNTGTYISSGINILCGSLNATDFCTTIENEVVNIYMKLPSYYNSFKVTVLNQAVAGSSKYADIFSFSNDYYGTTAPEGAVYATVRNNASADANGNSFDTNYVWHNNGQAQVNMLKDGTTSLDFNDYIEEGKYELQGNADTTVVNFPISSSNGSANNCNWYLRVFVRRSGGYVTQVAYSVRADNAISIRSKSNGTWGEWRLLFEDGIAQQIPAASQTVLGGVKAYTDSEGYFCIDTQ